MAKVRDNTKTMQERFDAIDEFAAEYRARTA